MTVDIEVGGDEAAQYCTAVPESTCCSCMGFYYKSTLQLTRGNLSQSSKLAQLPSVLCVSAARNVWTAFCLEGTNPEKDWINTQNFQRQLNNERACIVKQPGQETSVVDRNSALTTVSDSKARNLLVQKQSMHRRTGRKPLLFAA